MDTALFSYEPNALDGMIHNEHLFISTEDDE
jgi:hypothetical protein